MKKLMLTVVVILLSMLRIIAQSDYITHNAHVSFFSKAPITDVNAENSKVKAELNTSTHEINFAISMADFQFKNHKMGRDAEEKYLETKKYPQASFKGKFNGTVDYHKLGSYPVTATGTLKIHGVEKEVKERGTVTIGKGQIKLQSEFHVLLKDYNIETPKILGQEMTEDNVQVKVEATLLKRANNMVSKK